MISSAMRRIGSSCARSSRMPSSADRCRASGCGRRVSLNRRTSAASLASRKISVGIEPGIARSDVEHARELLEQRALAHVDDDGGLLDLGAGPQRQLREGRHQRDRQVVDAEVAEVLERADRLRLARARQPGQDDERGCRWRPSLSAPRVDAVGRVGRGFACSFDAPRRRRRRVPGRRSSASRSWRLEPRRQLRAACWPRVAQQLVARRHLHEDRDVAAGRDRHADRSAPARRGRSK